MGNCTNLYKNNVNVQICTIFLVHNHQICTNLYTLIKQRVSHNYIFTYTVAEKGHSPMPMPRVALLCSTYQCKVPLLPSRDKGGFLGALLVKPSPEVGTLYVSTIIAVCLYIVLQLLLCQTVMPWGIWQGFVK